MHIIFGNEINEEIEKKYTLLELDQMKLDPNGPVLEAYCLIDAKEIPVQELTQIEIYKNLHDNLMKNYRKKDWNFCEQAIEHLHGRWGGSVNSFYDEISQRIAKYKQQDPGPDWNGVYEKYNRGS